MNKRGVLVTARLFFALLTLAAVETQLVVHIQHRYDVVNFFSYFTNLSNIFASLVFIFGAVSLLVRREPTPTDEVIRGASVVAMAIVGIVYGILLRNEDLGTLLPWVNIVVHFIMPVAVIADWLYQPPAVTLGVRQLAAWLLYPLAFVVYTLIRGPIVHWYPYPFLNPANVGGYGSVALYCVAIFVTFVVVGSLLIFLANRLQRNVVTAPLASSTASRG